MKTRALSYVAALLVSTSLGSASAQSALATAGQMRKFDNRPDVAQVDLLGEGFRREAVASREMLLIARASGEDGAPIGMAVSDLGAKITYALMGGTLGPADKLGLVYSFTESAFCNTMPGQAFNLVSPTTAYTIAVEAPTVLERAPTSCNLTCESGLPALTCPAPASMPERMVARSTPLLVRQSGTTSLRLIRDDFNFLMVTIPFEFAPIPSSSPSPSPRTDPFPFFFNPQPDIAQLDMLASTVEDKIFAMGLPRLGIPPRERVKAGFELETFRRTTARFTTPPQGQIVDLAVFTSLVARGPEMRSQGIGTVRSSGPRDVLAPTLDRGQPGSAAFGFPLKSALAYVVAPPGTNPTNLVLEFGSGFAFPVSTLTECNDGIDNDGDGLTDFPTDCSDPGAARETAVTDADYDLIADDADTCPFIFNPFQEIPPNAVGCRAR